MEKGVDYMTDTLDSGTQKALRSLQEQAAMTTKGAGIRSSAVSAKYAKDQSGFSGLLDEWEKRQRKINNERDSRPVLLDGRQINRAKTVVRRCGNRMICYYENCKGNSWT